MYLPTSIFIFLKIKAPNDLFKWINDTMIPYLFRERDEYGMVLHWTERQFTHDHHLRLGPPRLRQLRIKRGIQNVTFVNYKYSHIKLID
jgi:hypothetical protein